MILLRIIGELLFIAQLDLSCLSVFETSLGKSGLVLKIDVVPFNAAACLRTD